MICQAVFLYLACKSLLILLLKTETMYKPPKIYRHLFIDLDKTLWDFDSNSRETFAEIFSHHQLQQRGITDLDRFLGIYNHFNEMLWTIYRQNGIRKEALNIRRFEMTLQEFGIIDPALAAMIAEDYILLSPKKTILFPYTQDALTYLGKKYPLHLITNGFEEVQQPKLDASDLRRHFTTVTTSEEAGVKKPEEGIFRLALQKAKAEAGESLMIGDDLQVDMEGARKLGMDTLYFNPTRITHQEMVTFEITSWSQIRKIL